MKKKLQHILWLTRRTITRFVQKSSWYVRRKSLVIVRKMIGSKKKNRYSFAILCIKKEAYAELVVRQANSLHYFNPTHTFTVYADQVCAAALKKMLPLFDYPDQITIKDAFGIATKPWTHYKMKMRIEVSRAGGVDIDADMVWHGDPVLDRSRPLMFAPARLFKEHRAESAVITQLFKKPEWLEYTHFISAFVSIPPKFMTEAFANDAQRFVDMILDNPLDFIATEEERGELRRVSEEISICFALQTHYPGLTAPLKKDGGRKNKELVEPIYYGVENRVTE